MDESVPDPETPQEQAARRIIDNARRPHRRGEAQPTAHAEAAPAGTPAARAVGAIHGRNIALTQFKRNHFTAYAPDDLTVADFENPAVWTAAKDVELHDRLEILQSTRWTDALVVDRGPGRVVLKVLATVELPAREAVMRSEIPAGYEIRVGEPGSLDRFISVRLHDGVVMNRGLHHATFEQALRHLIDHPIFR